VAILARDDGVQFQLDGPGQPSAQRSGCPRKRSGRKRKELASDAKSDFFSRMSHDIRTPLNVVIGSATLALKESNNSPIDRALPFRHR
jgi:signal transduction histidine kinase